MSGPEPFVIVWFEGDDIYALTDETTDNVLVRDRDSLKHGAIHGILSTEEELDNADSGVRYAVPVQLVRDVLGWDV